MSGNKKSAASGSWITCESCGCQEWMTPAHRCSGRKHSGPWLRGVLEVCPGNGNDTSIVTVSVSAARQCGLVLGETALIHVEDSEVSPIARRIWVSRSAAPHAIALSEEDLGSSWTKDKRTVHLTTLRGIQALIHDAKEVQLENADSNGAPAQCIMPLLKQHFLHRILRCGNELIYWHYGKRNTYKIIEMKAITPSDNVWFRIIHNTKLIIKTETCKDIKSSEKTLGGIEDIIEELESLMKPALLENSDSANSLSAPRGVLLFGHSGTGKTAICRYIINKFGLYHVTIEGPAIFSKYYGETEKTLLNLFKDAIDNQPSVILVDDVDTICPRKSSGGTEQERRVAAAFLSGLDSLQRGNKRVFVLATAARSDSLEPSLRRAGRLDRELEVCVPDRARRRRILRTILERVSHTLNHDEVEQIADAAHGYVAADVLNLCTQASTRRLRRPADSLGEKKLDVQDFKWALTVVKASAMREVLVEVPNVRWTDVGGQDDLKMQLRQAVEWPLKYADRFVKLGIEPPSGVLMYGPPGCSKTLVAKAIATESGLNFISIKGPELFSKWVGESERAVREVFARARRVAPAVVFFDELDALGGARGDGEAGGVRERVLAQLLTELDGVEPLRGVLVLGATNRPDRIDRALLRPGRLDRLVYVTLPDEKTRAEIFRIKLARVPLASDVDISELVTRTAGASGAEVQAVCHEAALRALGEDADAVVVTHRHFQAVLDDFNPRTPAELIQIYQRFSTINKA